MSLNRRDRAALVLAYEWCRASFRWTRDSHRKHREEDAQFAAGLATEALDLGGDAGEDIVAGTVKRNGGETLRISSRLLRARLALYLRALLRADAGDFGPLRSYSIRYDCGVCGANITGSGDAPCWNCGDDKTAPKRKRTIYGRTRITPLWQLAPATRPT